MNKSANTSVAVLTKTKEKKFPQLDKRVLSADDIAKFKEIIENEIKETSSFHEENLLEIYSGKGLANENNLSGNNYSFGSQTENINTSVRLAEHANKALRGNLNALRRINEGTYGLCPICVANNHGVIKDKADWEKVKNNPENYISYQRLNAYPAAKHCRLHTK